MYTKFIFIVIFILIHSFSFAQEESKTAHLASFSGAFGSNQGSISLDYINNWRLGKSKKIEIGGGIRFTSYFGSNRYHTSAPASLANENKNTDSLLINSPQVNSLNLVINLGYRISNKFNVGFNIDFIGFSFGGKQNSFYINGNQGQSVDAKPTAFNILLVGNNDRGSLNSEFYLRYFITQKIAVKGAFQYLFTEYTTDNKVQTQPESNDRFRNKASLASIGITKLF